MDADDENFSPPEPPPPLLDEVNNNGSGTSEPPPSFSLQSNRSPVEDYFSSMPTDFLDDDFYSGFIEENPELINCSLTPAEFEEFSAPPDCSQWSDYLAADHPTFITIDQSKEKQWTIAKEEIQHIREQIKKLIGKNNVEKKDVVLYTLGPESSVGLFLKSQLCLSDETYLKFMSTICIQSSYRVTSTELFSPMSILKREVKMAQEEYNKIWRDLSTKYELDGATMRTNRSEETIWHGLETIINALFKKISIENRQGEISIALDDDKIWVSQTKSKFCDLFGLRYTTHNQANRKGINLHSAISTGAMVPYACKFEQTFDNTLSCFKRVFNTLFRHDCDGKDDNAFKNVSVYSDRGYLIPTLVFDFLLSNGANVVGTVKRMAGCWPFTFDQKMSESDTRTKIDPKGAATLYLKWCKPRRGGGNNARAHGVRRLFASAFRNGSQRVATAISSIHAHHHWEGVAMYQHEHASWKRNKSSLEPYFFKRVDDIFLDKEEEEEKILLKEYLSSKIIAKTLRQGKSYFNLDI